MPTPIVTYDYDGLSRHVIHPYRGADEIPIEMLQLDLVSSVQGMSTTIETPFNLDLVLDDSTFSRFAKSSGVIGSSNNRGGVIVVFLGPGILGFGAMFGIVVFNPFFLNTWGPCDRPTVVCFDPFASASGSGAYFDFTYAISQAYGNNQILFNGVPSIYNGDVNQDMSIDLSDIISVFNSAQAFSSGYFLINDITRDQIVDLTDLIIVANNAANFVTAIAPGNKPLSRPSVSEVREVKKVNPKVNRLSF